MDFARYFGVAIAAFLGLTALAIFFYNLAKPHRPKPMMTGANRIAPYLAVLGAVGFTTAFGMLVANAIHPHIGLLLAGGGLLAIAGSILLNAATAKSKRSTWPVVPARCTNQLLKSELVEKRKTWSWQITCEVDHAGKKYRLCPKVRWSDVCQSELAFWKEAKARRYLAERVTPDGRCKLRVNPANRLEAELIN